MSTTEQQTNGTNTPARKGGSAQRIFTQFHTFLYRLSGGKIGGRFAKCPVLLLTTTGRKTGKPRTLPLLYLKENNKIVLVASNGGAPRDPLWWRNLVSQPQATVEIGREKFALTARQANEEEYAYFWPLLVKMYPSYAEYQKKTTRKIPVVILETITGNGNTTL